MEEDVLGTIRIFAGITQRLPYSYIVCNGQMLNMDNFTALFSILNNTFGGNYMQFNLPDYRQLSQNIIGQKYYNELYFQHVICSNGLYPRGNSSLDYVYAAGQVVIGLIGQPCNGSNLNINEYQRLNYVIGKNFPVAGSTTQFQLPNTLTYDENMLSSMYTNAKHIICQNGFIPTTSTYVDYLGMVTLFAGEIPPINWMFCDGSVLQVSEYQNLYTVIGNIYGGNTQNFILPNTTTWEKNL
ncbi:MAG: hypothetical protein RL154_1268, partial [Pseudomonadota bacterium]